jgi:uncharacterized membrane protein YkvI
MKGASMIIGLFMTVVVLAIFYALLPTMNTIISALLPSLSSADQILIQLLTTAIIIVILTATIENKMSEGIA